MKGPPVSAGVLLYRRTAEGLEVLLAHPGGPFWENRDEGVWTIPKGAAEPGEDLFEAAVREFFEETGTLLEGPFEELGFIQLKSKKIVYAWACEGDLDATLTSSNSIEMEWPPRSGKVSSFPEIDRCEWFDLEAGKRKINPAQVELLERLVYCVG